MLSSEIVDDREIVADIAENESEPGVLDEAGDLEAEGDQASSEGSPLLYEITSYGADYTVDVLVKRMNSEEFYVPPFQRRYVWSQTEASRFIESLLFGFPVPAVFLNREAKNRYLIVDGQQRLKTLQFFYAGTFSERKFRLIGVNSEFLGKTYAELAPEYQRRLSNAVIHSIIVQQDEPTNDGDSSIYLIFERLNSGGRPLFAQEIRTCVDHGPFIELLHRLNTAKTWRKLYGPQSRRLKDEELILRFLALHDEAEQYAAPMKAFLNNYSRKKRNVANGEATRLEQLFVATTETIFGLFGASAFRPITALNAAVFDAVMIGISRRLANGPITDKPAAEGAYRALLGNEDFKQAYTRATARIENVSTRLRLATEAFAGIG